eukprot:2323760-Rhodomonas_salina.1
MGLPYKQAKSVVQAYSTLAVVVAKQPANLDLAQSQPRAAASEGPGVEALRSNLKVPQEHSGDDGESEAGPAQRVKPAGGLGGRARERERARAKRSAVAPEPVDDDAVDAIGVGGHGGQWGRRVQ